MANQTVTVIQQESNNASPMLVRWATTDSDGRYAIRWVRVPTPYSALAESKHVELKVAGEETIEHNIEVTTTPRSILTGIVRAGGKPLVSALVSAGVCPLASRGLRGDHRCDRPF